MYVPRREEEEGKKRGGGEKEGRRRKERREEEEGKERGGKGREEGRSLLQLSSAHPYKELNNDGSPERAGHVQWGAVTMEMVDIVRSGMCEEAQTLHLIAVLNSVHQPLCVCVCVHACL